MLQQVDQWVMSRIQRGVMAFGAETLTKKRPNHMMSLGFRVEGPHNKGYSILGSMLGYPYFGNLPCRV